MGCLVLLGIGTFFQYNACFFATYKESGVRRIALAEKLPLSYFGKKDLSDLTSTIMADCATMETASSHWIPELFGGERQRISIARAFIKDAPIILLDEATASLDVENESQIQAALSRLIANKTVLVIAHRMRTVAGADQVVVLADGTVVESGTPTELLQKDGIFRHMAQLQSQGQTWAL